MRENLYFHGTSSALRITDALLPPSMTQLLSESGRKKNLDKVFFTMDIGSAKIYAAKAVKRFGGLPVVLKVVPNGDITVIQSTKGTTVFMADNAEVIK